MEKNIGIIGFWMLFAGFMGMNFLLIFASFLDKNLVTLFIWIFSAFIIIGGSLVFIRKYMLDD